MNVIFHVMTAISLGGIAAKGSKPQKIRVRTVVLIFIVGILLHGLLDVLPHQYPLPKSIDVTVSTLTMVIILSFLKANQIRIIFATAFLGSIFPDLVDFGPVLMNRLFGMNIPTFKIFPWHWDRFSGSIMGGGYNLKSLISHAAVILINVLIFFTCSLKNKLHLENTSNKQ